MKVGTKQVLFALVAVLISLSAYSQSPSPKMMTLEFDKLLSAQFKPGETGCAALVAIKLSPEILKRYAGDYQLMPGFILAVTVEGDRIFTMATGQSKVEIYPESETKFFLKGVDASLDFVADESGNYNKGVLHQGGKDLEGKR